MCILYILYVREEFTCYQQWRTQSPSFNPWMMCKWRYWTNPNVNIAAHHLCLDHTIY